MQQCSRVQLNTTNSEQRAAFKHPLICIKFMSLLVKQLVKQPQTLYKNVPGSAALNVCTYLLSLHICWPSITTPISEGTLFFVTFKTFENRDTKDEHYYFPKIIGSQSTYFVLQKYLEKKRKHIIANNLWNILEWFVTRKTRTTNKYRQVLNNGVIN